MRRRLARGLAVGVASGALLLAPMAAVASADQLRPSGTIWEFDWIGPGTHVDGSIDDGAPLVVE